MSAGASQERVPPLRPEADPRVRVQMRPGKYALIYPGLMRVSSGACSARQAPGPGPLAAAPDPAATYPMRTYRTPSGHHGPLGGTAIRLLRYLYALPEDAVIPSAMAVADAVGTNGSNVTSAFATLAVAGAIRHRTGAHPGGLRWRVLALVETGRVLRTSNAPADVTP
jgi:hypothetical protein